MRSLRRFVRRLRASLTHPQRDDDLRGEIETHIGMLTDEYVRAGMPPDEARRAAALKFGSVPSATEHWRDQRRLPLVDTAIRDVRFALRGLVRQRGFTLVAVLTLALGIGATTAIFSVVHAVLLRPLAYPEADRLVRVWETNPQANRWGDWASYPDFDDWRRENAAFDSMAAFRYGRVTLAHGDVPEMLISVRASPDFFRVLRMDPMLGRAFAPDDDQPGRSDVVVLSYGVWQRQFGSEAAIVGRTIPIDGRGHLVLGVMPPGFDFPANVQPGAKPPDVWVPLTPDRARGSHNFRVIARLESDRTIAQARTDMDRVMRIVGELDPAHRGRGAAVVDLQQHAVGGVRQTLLLLMGGTVLVLMIACANVANLLLARGMSRQRELALRLALGASHARVLQQGLIECVVLALAGAAAGLLIAFGGTRLLVALAPPLPLLDGVGIDAQVLAFAIATALVTGVVFGLVPTIQALKVQASEALKDAGTRHAGGVRHARIRRVLTVAELALALMLMIGAGLFLRSFVELRGVDMGFAPDRLLTAILNAPPAAASRPERVVAFFEEAIARAAQVPGIAHIAGASAVPLIGNESSPFRLEDAVRANERAGDVFAEQPKITPEYFAAMGIRTIAGRTFDRGDVPAGEPVAIVSKGLADTYWPGDSAIGKRLQIDDTQWRRIVGIVQDVRHDGVDRPLRPTIYIPFAQYPRSTMTLLVRSDGDPQPLIAPLRQAMLAVDRGQPLFGVQTMAQTVSASLSTRRLLMVLTMLFAIIAAALGTIGLYGVVAYFVGQRRPELAIRAALGASGGQVIATVLGEALMLAGAGVVIGLAGSFAVSRVVSGLLFGVSPFDPWTFAAMPLLLIALALAAAWLPARRVSRIGPIEALRGE